ncbi:MAG: YciI family protein [Ilumatobacteraceae bacterium]
MSLHVLFYESAEDVLLLVPAHYPAHRERLVEFKARGDLVLVGVFDDAQRDGSMSVFTTRQAAEDFVAGDPFVREGVVRSWTIKEWHESIGDL